MQELIEWTYQYQGQMISADQVVLKAHKLLEKEKEQIIDAYLKDRKGNIVKCLKSLDNSEDYYTNTYNL